jgi:uncharacterized OB-fold protein
MIEAQLEYPYTRTLGAVMGEFFMALRQGRLLGIKAQDGRVLFPPAEFDPSSGASLTTDRLVEVGPEATVEAWTWVDEPTPKHPLDHPFAFALVKPDGADTAMVAVVDAGGPDRMKTGMRVSPRYRAEPKGLITDLEAFEPAGRPAHSPSPADAARRPVTEATAQAAGGDGMTPKEHLVMEHLVSLAYREQLTPNLGRFVDCLMEGHLTGHRCPSCRRVYIPPKGYCPLCVVPTSTSDEVELPDLGTVTGFTIVTPVAYYGQQETEPFVYASVLLDGADTPLTGQSITGIPHEQLRMGLRVKAIWKPPEERSTEGISNRGWGALGSVIASFEPTGEPDAGEDVYRDHIF